MKKLLLSLLICFSVNADYSRYFVAFEPETASILLSDDSVWKLNYTLENESILSYWTVGDYIEISTKEKPGYELFNLTTYTGIFAWPVKESLVNLPTITKLEIIKGGWFSSDKHFVHLSDGTSWELVGRLTYSWKVGQRVLVSKTVLGAYHFLVNLQVPFDEKYVDDRGFFVTKK